MALFEDLYGRKCKNPIFWDGVGEERLKSPKFIQQLEEKNKLVQEHLKTAQSCEKSYTDFKKRGVKFNVGIVCSRKFLP